MAVVAATAVVLAVWRLNPFLALVAVFSFYFAFRGRRVLGPTRPQHVRCRPRWTGSPRSPPRPPAAPWWSWALVQPTAAWAELGRVAVVFGGLGLLIAGLDVRRFLRPPADRNAWWFTHMTGMLGSYLAAVSAFSVVNFTFLPTTLRWLWPTVTARRSSSCGSRTTSAASPRGAIARPRRPDRPVPDRGEDWTLSRTPGRARLRAMADGRQALGRAAEEAAAAFLRRAGMTVIERNVRFQAGELDLVCRDADVVVFVEVKCRRAGWDAAPSAAVSWHKQRRLTQLAQLYLKFRRLTAVRCRFDVVSVTHTEHGGLDVRHVRAAFDAVE